MYISVPKNYGGNAFPHPDAGEKRGTGAGMPRPTPPFAPFGAQPQPSPPPRPIVYGGSPSPVAPLGKIPRDLPPPPPPPPDCGCDACGTAETCGEDAAENGRASCGEPPCGAAGKNPLTCLFEALHGRKKGGFDADDFLLIGLIALLMGREGNEDIVLILGLLLLI